MIGNLINQKSRLESIDEFIEFHHEKNKRDKALHTNALLKKAIVNNDMDSFWQATIDLKKIFEEQGTFNIQKEIADAITYFGEDNLKNTFPMSFSGLHQRIGDWRKGAIYTVFGHPAHGKTTTGLNLALRTLYGNKKVLFVTAEETIKYIIARYMALRSEINLFDL